MVLVVLVVCEMVARGGGAGGGGGGNGGGLVVWYLSGSNFCCLSFCCCSAFSRAMSVISQRLFLWSRWICVATGGRVCRCGGGIEGGRGAKARCGGSAKVGFLRYSV